MNLSQIIAAASLIGMAGMYAWKPDDSARLLAADAMLSIANKKIGELQKERALLVEISDANLAALESVKADLERQAAIAVKAQAAERKRAAELNAAKKRIRNVPKTDDGPVAPVLRRELDGLRADGVRPDDGAGDAPADTADADPSGAPADRPVEPHVPDATPSS